MKSNQAAINELSQLLKFGAKQLEDVFRDVLRRDTGTIEPLHYLTKGEVYYTRLLYVRSLWQENHSPIFPKTTYLYYD